MLLLVFHLLWADVTSVNALQIAVARDGEYESLLRRFRPYERNYAIWQWTRNDQEAMEVQYSFKYIMYDCKNIGYGPLFGCRDNGMNNFNLFFSYTGQFDFYVGTRPSGPVINRLSNPALHLSYDELEQEGDNPKKTRWSIDLSVEHRSDGQAVDPELKDTNPSSPNFGKFITQIEYEKGNNEYFDRISVGANYVRLSGYYSRPNTDMDIELSGKAYFSDESSVTWGKYAGQNVSFSDFDLIQIKLRDKWFQRWHHVPNTILALEYSIGNKGFATDSVDLFLTFPWLSDKKGWNLPVFIKAHTGPMERLSDFSRSVDSIGFGFSFLY